MRALLRGIKKVEYIKKDTKELKRAIELHCERKPYPTEPFVMGSDVVFTEYLPITENSEALVAEVLKMPIGSVLDLQYVQNGKYANLVDVSIYEG